MNGDLCEHSGPVVAGEVAHEDVGAWLGEVDGTRLALARIDVVPVADLVEAWGVLRDVAVSGERELARSHRRVEHQQLMLDGPIVEDRVLVLSGSDVCRRGDLELSEADGRRRGRCGHHHDRVHAQLEMAGKVAYKEVFPRRRQVDRSSLDLPGARLSPSLTLRMPGR